MAEINHDYMVVSLAGKLRDKANSFIKDELNKAGIADLLPCHGDILHACFVQPGIKVTEIAKLTHRSKSTVSVMVDKLKALGYLEKVADKDDPRAMSIHPSQKAYAIFDSFKSISNEMNQKFAGSLSDDELQTLQELLSRAIKALEQDA
ncbi:MAG: MarR family transcriptional regulator [Succinivibrio sp.]|nr:MarR family transcriptional regulator [Succinivibrio sp.]